MNRKYDVIIIGGGVIGCAIARELSRYDLHIGVLEKEEDVCSGTSKANSGIVHAGYDAKPGTKKAKFNVLGNALFEQLATELEVPFKRIGSLVTIDDNNQFKELELLMQQGIKNGVKGLAILDQEEVKKIEPNLADSVVAALYAPSAGIVCPFELTIAFAENAVQNGVHFHLHTFVEDIHKVENVYTIVTNKETYESNIIVNAAGVYADEIHNMVAKRTLKITPRSGEYCLLDQTASNVVSHTIFQLPTKYGKGVLVTPTVHGNLLIGPTATDLEDKEATNTTAVGLNTVIEKSKSSIKSISYDKIITSFAGLRAHTDYGDFIIEELEDTEGFFDVAGIDSPGLTSSPAIGSYVAKMVAEKMNAKRKHVITNKRTGITKLGQMTLEERQVFIKDHPKYGNIICRCEMISEGEIIEAIHNPLGAISFDAIKRRTRTGMGRCQSGFCMPKILSIISRELDIPMEQIYKSGVDSNLVIGKMGGEDN